MSELLDGMLPLNQACGGQLLKSSVNIIQFLTSSCPGSWDVECHGPVPTAHGLSQSARSENCASLYPVAVGLPDQGGYQHPLHCACFDGSQVDVIERLAELYPSAVGTAI